MSLSPATADTATSAPLRLQRPPDHSRSLLVLAIGLAAAVVLFMLTRSTLSHVGDNIHALPHGGCYRDGTKTISYRGPGSSFPASSLLGFAPLILALALFALTYPALAPGHSSCRRCVTITHQCATQPSS